MGLSKHSIFWIEKNVTFIKIFFLPKICLTNLRVMLIVCFQTYIIFMFIIYEFLIYKEKLDQKLQHTDIYSFRIYDQKEVNFIAKHPKFKIEARIMNSNLLHFTLYQITNIITKLLILNSILYLSLIISIPSFFRNHHYVGNAIVSKENN